MTELFPKSRFNKCIIQEQVWENLNCRECGGEMEMVTDNEFESVKVCLECGDKALLIKKIRKEEENE